MPPTKRHVEAPIDGHFDEASANHLDHGIILPGDKQKLDDFDVMAYPVLNDVIYNALHDLLMPIYREEKMARCNTAAILLENKAEEARLLEPNPPNDASAPDTDNTRIQTDAAYFDVDGNVSLHDHINVFETVKEVYCPDCRLPRFPYPLEGEGSRKPDSGIQYCKKRVFVKNWPADIYNQKYVADKKGPGKGNGGKKKDPTKEMTPSGSQDSPTTSPPANDFQDKPIPYPTVKCPAKGCTRSFPISRIGAHLARDHGTGRRAANRDALERIQNNGSGYTSSGSRNATPAPTNVSKGRSSPSKRDADDFEFDESPQKLKKAKTVAKKLKAPSMTKSSSQISSSNLQHMETPLSDDEYGDGDDQRDGDFGTISVDIKKKKKPVPKVTKSKPVKEASTNGDWPWSEKEKKKKATKTPATTSKKPRPVTPPDSQPKIKIEINGHAKKVKDQNGPRGESDSSQTLSSPN